MGQSREDPGCARYAGDPNQADESIVNQLLEDRLGRVEAELTAATGGASLCSISKVAGSVPAAKYLEGRLAVLLQLRRSPSAIQEALAAVDNLRDEWATELERVTREAFGPDWLAYRAGGVDELDELATSLRTN